MRHAVFVDAAPATPPERVLDELAADRTTTVFGAGFDPAFVRAAHDRGIAVVVQVEGTAARVRAAIDTGVDGVLLDATHPDAGELVGAARAHTPPILVAAAFDDLGPEHAALVDDLDIIVTGPRSPTGYRLLAACARGTEVVVRDDRPTEDDRDTTLREHYTAAANGAAMAIRYDPSPSAPLAQIKAFLADRDELLGGRSGHDVAIAFTGDHPPYRAVVDLFARAGVPYDIVPFPDGVTAPDRLTAADLYDYDELILPAGSPLTEGQVGALNRYLDGGAGLAYLGDVDWSLRDRPSARVVTDADVDGLLSFGRQVEVAGGGITTTITRLAGDREALHVLNDGPRRNLPLTASLATVHTRATAYRCDGTVTALDLRTERLGHRHTVTLTDLGPYAIVLFAPQED